jgi:hypothetical protein
MQRTKIAPNMIVKSDALRMELLQNGFFISDISLGKAVDEILNFYKDKHHFENAEGGSFWSIYSKDEAYKRETHAFLEDKLKQVKEHYLGDYKSLLNAFVIKTSGSKSAFGVHQDTTAMDEEKYSPLSIWIPLQDVDESNGCLYIIPYTHNYTLYYRGVSIPSKFCLLGDSILKYGIPLRLKKGQALFFDNRLLHFSPPFSNGQQRIAVVCGVMPLEARYINCFLNSDNEIELLAQEDDFILSNPYFLDNATQRPINGVLIKKVKFDNTQITIQDWENVCKENNILPQNNLDSLGASQAYVEPK